MAPPPSPSKSPNPISPPPREVEISSEVTDANHQTLTARSTTTVHPAAVYVGISRIDTLVRAGQPLPLKIAAIDTEEQPFGQALKLTATLTREVNSAVKTQTESGATTTRNDVTEETVSTSELTLDPARLRPRRPGRSPSPRNPTACISSPSAAPIPQGRPVATVTRFHVYGTNEYPWLYEDGLRVKLVAEKKSYQPGETARVLVLSPIEGTALVTVEREKVLRSFQVQLKADNPVIEIPLTDDDAPERLRFRAHRQGRQGLRPQVQGNRSSGSVIANCSSRTSAIDSPSRSTRRPKATAPAKQVSLSGTVTLAGGKPAAGAEVTLYAEDEGTLAVMGYETPKPMEHFYQATHPRRGGRHLVRVVHRRRPGNAGLSTTRASSSAAAEISGKLADLLRKNFDPCATWAPTLVTDAAGKFSHSFKLPDTLTRYRVIAIAHHELSRFGHAESAIVAKKDLMLEPKAPRFANQTDTISPQVLVQNASRFAGTWEIQFNAHAAAGTPVCRALGSHHGNRQPRPRCLRHPGLPHPRGKHRRSRPLLESHPRFPPERHLNDDLTRRLSDAVEARFQVLYPMPLSAR